MKTLCALFAFLLSLPSWSQVATLTTVRAVHSITDAEAKRKLPVDLQATVTYYDNLGQDLFVQDGDVAVYVFAKPGGGFVPGDRVRVRGITDSDFRPDVVADDVSLIRHGIPPAPLRARFSRLIQVDMDCLRVVIAGRVRSADLVKERSESAVYLNLLVDGGYIDATVIGYADPDRLKDLLDTEVEITGAVAGKFDSKMQLAGIMLQVSSLADVKVLHSARRSPASLPVTAMNEILSGYSVDDHTERVHVHGTITYYQPGTALVLQDGPNSLWISTQRERPLRIGNVADVTGFPDIRNGYATLTQSEVTETHVRDPVSVLASNRTELASGAHAFELVSAEGIVLADMREAAQDEYVLSAGGGLFSAIYRHPDPLGSSLAPMKEAPVGSRIRVTGICTMEHGSDPLGNSVAFNILLRDFDDVTVLMPPSWLTVTHLLDLVALLLVIVIAVSIRGWMVEHRMRRQAAVLANRIAAEAEIERRRSRILEDINSGRELGEILDDIAALVSFTLKDSPCWFRLAGREQSTRRAAASAGQTEIHKEIPAHSGASHGEMFALVRSDDRIQSDAGQALARGVRLAALAIETRGLYSDLVHRSEFDLLTDIRNRFSFEKGLEHSIRRAAQRGGMMGLIYVDLDDFKKVNDGYGHHVGDLFLQEAARRMKHQLRPGDLLARLGGDEFGVVVPSIANRADLKEIAGRLKRCFEGLFAIESYKLQASASVGIAVYPEDGDLKDSLLSAADASMYLSKHDKEGIKDLS